MQLPALYKIHQSFDGQQVDDIPARVSEQIAALNLHKRIKPGQTVAITGGSRGIANIPLILKSVVDELKSLGLKPFLVPAMGSHGGATAEGQRKILHKYGMTEQAVGCEIRASMDVVELGWPMPGIRVVEDRNAYEADWVVVVNRAKPHTRFDGEIESGLCKMILIGLGKTEGATLYHKAAVNYSFGKLVEVAVPFFLEKANLLFGMGLVENGYEETAIIEAAPPEGLIALDKKLLAEAKRMMPKLPFNKIDVVIVDEMGKNYSGTGMDTNIIGSKSSVEITRVFVRDLHPSSEGNAAGVGFADMITDRMRDKIDLHATALNCMTAQAFAGARVPVSFPTDRDALTAAMATIGLTESHESGIVWIPNTLHLKEVMVSETFMEEVEAREDLAIVDGPHEMVFDEAGNLVDAPFRH